MAEVFKELSTNWRVKAEDLQCFECFEEAEFVMVMLARLKKQFTENYTQFKQYRQRPGNRTDLVKSWYAPNEINSLRVLKAIEKIQAACLSANKSFAAFKKSREMYDEEKPVFIMKE